MLFEIVSEKISSIVETVILENFTGKALVFYSVISIFCFYQLKLLGRVNPMIFLTISQKSAILDRVNPMVFFKIRDAHVKTPLKPGFRYFSAETCVFSVLRVV